MQNPNSYVLCQICRQAFKRVTRTHLIKHFLTTKEYQAKFPGTPLMCEDLLAHNANLMRANPPMRDPAVRRKASEARKGVVFSEEHKRNISKARCGSKWPDGSEDRKRHQSEIAYKYLVPSARERRAAGWTPRLSEAGRESLRIKTRLRYLANPIPTGNNKGKKLNLTREQRANRSEKRVRYLSQQKEAARTSRLETRFAEFLCSYTLRYSSQFPIYTERGSWLYDFYLPDLNLLVEIDGEWWHATPGQMVRDKIKQNLAFERGFRLLRISDQNWIPNLVFANAEEWKLHNHLVLQRRSLNLRKRYVRISA